MRAQPARLRVPGRAAERPARRRGVPAHRGRLRHPRLLQVHPLRPLLGRLHRHPGPRRGARIPPAGAPSAPAARTGTRCPTSTSASSAASASTPARSGRSPSAPPRAWPGTGSCSACAPPARTAAWAARPSCTSRTARWSRSTGAGDVPPNRGRLCKRGRFAVLEPDERARLEEPLVRKNGVLVKASWDEALDLVAEKLGRRPASVAGLIAPLCTNEEAYQAQKFFRAVLGTNDLDHRAVEASRVSLASAGTGAGVCYTSGALTRARGGARRPRGRRRRRGRPPRGRHRPAPRRPRRRPPHGARLRPQRPRRRRRRARHRRAGG